MTLQNRVTPFGEIVAVAARGTLMGNRGCLHDSERRIVKSSARVAWVTCRLEWQGMQRQIMAPGKYTELFFLDEATALAAGHRPCFECRRQDALRRLAAGQIWQRGKTERGLGGPALVAPDRRHPPAPVAVGGPPSPPTGDPTPSATGAGRPAA